MVMNSYRFFCQVLLFRWGNLCLLHTSTKQLFKGGGKGGVRSLIPRKKLSIPSVPIVKTTHSRLPDLNDNPGFPFPSGKELCSQNPGSFLREKCLIPEFPIFPEPPYSPPPIQLTKTWCFIQLYFLNLKYCIFLSQLKGEVFSNNISSELNEMFGTSRTRSFECSNNFICQIVGLETKDAICIRSFPN